jgi:hypothetical protein
MATNEPRIPAGGEHELDAVLSVQLVVAWAGETVGGEDHLGWWRTELTDPEAGGDFLARPLGSVEASAAYLGIRKETFYCWIAQRGLPVVRLGRL